MKFREGEDAVIVRTAFKCSCGGNHNQFYHGGKLDDVRFKSQGKIIRVESDDKLLLRLKDGRTFWLHPDELDLLNNGGAILPGIQDLPKHPVFEIAEQTPVFLIGDKVYSLGEGNPQEGDNFYEQTEKGMLKTLFNKGKITRRPLVEVGDFDSLEAIVLDRVKLDMERIGEEYAREARRDLSTLRKIDGDLDVPQLIFKQVFPYLQDGHYRDKVSELLGVEKKVEVFKKSPKKAEVTKKLEQIADEAVIEVNDLIRQIEEDKREYVKRTEKQSKLDSLFEYEEPKPYTGTLLGRALSGRDVAIVEGAVYDLVAGSDGSKEHFQINGKIFSLIERKEEKPRPQEFGKGVKVRIRKDSRFAIQNKGVGEMTGIFGDNGFIDGELCAQVIFEDGYKNTYRERDLEFAEEILEIRKLSSQGLEEMFLIEMGKKAKVDALRKHLSRDRIVDLLRTQDSELLSMAGKVEHHGEGFGFVNHEGTYYVYLEVPRMAIKSEIDENYYLYDKSKIAVEVSKDGQGLNYGRDMRMIDNNGHPYVHSKNERFAKICQGDAASKMPTSGKDNGEVIVKRLRKMREVLMFGYTWTYFDPVFEGKERGKNYALYRRSLSELKRMKVPIISKGD